MDLSLFLLIKGDFGLGFFWDPKFRIPVFSNFLGFFPGCLQNNWDVKEKNQYSKLHKSGHNQMLKCLAFELEAVWKVQFSLFQRRKWQNFQTGRIKGYAYPGRALIWPKIKRPGDFGKCQGPQMFKLSPLKSLTPTNHIENNKDLALHSKSSHAVFRNWQISWQSQKLLSVTNFFFLGILEFFYKKEQKKDLRTNKTHHFWAIRIQPIAARKAVFGVFYLVAILNI